MGLTLRRLVRSRVIVVFGATSRIGKATIERLTAAQPSLGVTVVAAVEWPKDPRVQQLKQTTGCFVIQCDFAKLPSLQRVVRNADSVLLIPALSEAGTRFSKRVLDACSAEEITRVVLISSILATADFWCGPSRGDTGQGSNDDSDHGGGADHPHHPPEAYEAIEAHARSLGANSVTLRIPLLMETIIYCRDEILYAHRLLSCFAPTTPVPCIAVQDVALAATEVLTQPETKHFRPMYCLAGEGATCSPVELTTMLTTALGRRIQYRVVSDARLTELLRDKGASAHVAHNTIRLKTHLEHHVTVRGHDAHRDEMSNLGFTNDFRLLMKRDLRSPAQWLQENLQRFVRSPMNQMQLFVLGSGEGLFQEVERLVAQQVTAPLAMPQAELGEAAIPTHAGVAQQSKATFCTIKALPGTQQRHALHVPDQEASTMTHLLGQLTNFDVILFIPPLRLGPRECMEVLHDVVDAAKTARVWGIVFVSTIFTGQGWNDGINRMGEMEQYIERSGVPFAILRLPLFMEYFLALTASPRTDARDDTLLNQPAGVNQMTESKPRPRAAEVAQAHSTPWYLLDRGLSQSPQYLISTTDAAKALVAVAYTFPLHRNKIRPVYTDCRTMKQIEEIFQRYSHKGARIDFSAVDALHEEPGHEFWRVTYWTQEHIRQFLETAVHLSGEHEPVKMLEPFEEVTECQPITLEKWAQRNSKALTHALAVTSTASPAVAAAAPHIESTIQLGDEEEENQRKLPPASASEHTNDR